MNFIIKENFEEIKKVLESIEKDITPTQEQRNRLKEVEKMISERLNEKKLKFIIGGSYARDTWLPEDADIDFFVLYDPELGPNEIGKKGLEDLKEVVKGLNYWLNYAEHPYIEGAINGVKFNLVPCADVPPGKWLTSMDRSRYHNEYLMKRLNDNLRKEIRILKKFLKSNGLYGAEIKIGGFSGYVSEVLIVKYGSFLELLKNVIQWSQGEIIALEPFDYDPQKVFTTPIIILDPVDQKRNLALAIKNKLIAKLKILALEFLSYPKIDYFREKKIRPDLKPTNNVIVFSFKASDLVEDIKWGMYYKAEDALRNGLKTAGYKIIRSAISENKGWVSFVFLLEFTKRSFEIRVGPSVYSLESSIAFLKSHRFVWVENDMRMYSFEPSKFDDAKKVFEKIKSEPIRWGVPAGIARNFSEGSAYWYSELNNASEHAESANEAFALLFETLSNI